MEQLTSCMHLSTLAGPKATEACKCIAPISMLVKQMCSAVPVTFANARADFIGGLQEFGWAELGRAQIIKNWWAGKLEQIGRSRNARRSEI